MPVKSAGVGPGLSNSNSKYGAPATVVLAHSVSHSGPLGKPIICFNCLGLGHQRKQCSEKVRCCSCFNYGHVSSAYLSKHHNQRRYVPKPCLEGKGVEKTSINPDGVPHLASSVSPKPPENPTSRENHASTMANWAVDPRPFILEGFTLEEPVSHPSLHQEVYLTGCYTLYNEDLAIMKLNPPVNKSREDFKNLADGPRVFFHDVH